MQLQFSSVKMFTSTDGVKFNNSVKVLMSTRSHCANYAFYSSERGNVPTYSTAWICVYVFLTILVLLAYQSIHKSGCKTRAGLYNNSEIIHLGTLLCHYSHNKPTTHQQPPKVNLFISVHKGLNEMPTHILADVFHSTTKHNVKNTM